MFRRLALILEVLILSALILATRGANYRDVFLAGNVYFADADCYARMTRVRICAQHPGKIVRHHDFENFPQGTSPHTTAPLDYSILSLALLLKPLTAQSLDVAGAIISPLLAMLTGGFLCWWSRRMRLRYRWTALLLFALSPILVHGTELGRPDHQSLLLLLLAIAICAEWNLRVAPSRGWGLTSGLAWGMALWVSIYEPVILLLVIGGFYAVCDRQQFRSAHRRLGWIAFIIVVAVGFLIERRLPSFPIFTRDPIFRNWAGTIGELMPVHVTDPIWFRWFGWILIAAPWLLWFATRKRFVGATVRRALPVVFSLLAACYLLTLWQARWAYFFGLMFALALPAVLESFKYRPLVWIVFAISLFPILQEWDARLWPNESTMARHAQARREEVEWRALAGQIRSGKIEAFLAPWWLSPAISYWSKQPGVAGSSHESMPGITESARFYLTSEANLAHDIVRRRHVAWVFVDDSDRVRENSAALLNARIATGGALAEILDRHPSRAPSFLRLESQNGSGKLYSVNQFP